MNSEGRFLCCGKLTMAGHAHDCPEHPPMTAPDPAPPEWDALREQLERARRHISNIAAGRERWTMRIPANRDDTDLMVCDALDAAIKHVAALEADRAALEARLAEHRRVLKDARECEQLQEADPVLCCDIDNVMGGPDA